MVNRKTRTRAALRVIHLYRRFQPDFTGDGIYYERLLPLVSELNNSCHEVLALETAVGNYPASREFPREPRRVHYLSTKHRKAGEAALVLWLLRNIRNFDIVHVHTHLDRHFIGYMLCRLAGSAIVYSSTLADSADDLIATYQPFFRPLVAYLFSLINAFVAISPRLSSEGNKRIGGERAVLIPQGVSIPIRHSQQDRAASRSSLGLSDDDLVLLYVGSISRRKAIVFLIHEFSVLSRNDPRLRLYLVGPALEEDYRREVERAIESAKLSSKVIRVPFTESPADFYQAADIFVFASTDEGFGNVLLEAMSFGLPVVCRYLDGVTPWFVNHGQTGFLFSDSCGFQSAVSELAGSADLRARIGGSARQFVVQGFAIEGIAKRIAALYSALPRIGIPPRHVSDRMPNGCRATAAGPKGLRMTRVDPRGGPPTLSIVVDTESEFDWSKGVSADRGNVESIFQLPRIHDICAPFGARVCFVTDYPVASTSSSAAIMRRLIEDGAEIGAHLQPWTTPPMVEPHGGKLAFPGNLPPPLEHLKLQMLKTVIETHLGVVPRVYKAGRYGVGEATLESLEALGFDVDLSVAPGFSYALEGGPDFGAFTAHLYSFGSRRTLLEIPTTSGFVGALADLGPRVWQYTDAQVPRWIHVRGTLDRLRLLSRVRLSPEGHNLSQMRRLTEHLMSRGCRHFTLSLHSSSLQPNYTPYSSNDADVTMLLNRIHDYLSYFRDHLGGRWCTPLELFSEVRDGLKVPA